MAIQITPKRKKVVDETAAALVMADHDGRRLESYEDLVESASRYITVHGMYELKQGVEFKPLNSSLNPDSFSWKAYETSLRLNSFNEQEIILDLSDSVLAGSSDSPTYMDQSLARLQIRLNDTRMKIDSYRSCQKDEYR